MKVLSPQMSAAISSDSLALMTAVFIDLSPTEKIRVHSSIGEYTINGEVFSGVGDYGSIEAIVQDGSTSPDGLSMSISGIDPFLVSEVLVDGYQGRDVQVFFCIFDGNDYSNIYYHLIFRGRLDVMSVNIGKTATIKIDVENRLIDWSRGNAIRWNHESHSRTLDVGVTDDFFNRVEETVDKEIQFDPYISEPD